MADVKIIIVEHLMKMHNDLWLSMEQIDESNRDDPHKYANKCTLFQSIQSSLKDIAMSENTSLKCNANS